MQSKGQILGSTWTTVFIPVGRALEMFHRESLQEIHITYERPRPSPRWEEASSASLVARHGAEDFTVTPQQKCWKCSARAQRHHLRRRRQGASRCGGGVASSPSSPSR